MLLLVHVFGRDISLVGGLSRGWPLRLLRAHSSVLVVRRRHATDKVVDTRFPSGKRSGTGRESELSQITDFIHAPVAYVARFLPLLHCATRWKKGSESVQVTLCSVRGDFGTGRETKATLEV